MPGQPLNSSGVDDPRLTEMIKLQRRTFDVKKRREIIYDIQRYASQQVYYVYSPSVKAVGLGAPRQELGGPTWVRLWRADDGGLARPLTLEWH